MTIYILSCLFNIISINKLLVSFNCSTTFSKDSFVIHECGRGLTIIVGYSGWLYCVKPTSIICFAKSPHLTHEHLSPPILSKHKYIVSIVIIMENSFYLPSFVMGRLELILPYLSYNPIFRVLIEYLSLLGINILTFVDEFFQCIWVYQIKQHFELFLIFHCFCAEMTQTDQNIVLFVMISSFLWQHYILHQSTCPHIHPTCPHIHPTKWYCSRWCNFCYWTTKKDILLQHSITSVICWIGRIIEI